jgi:hypothetical protein
MDTSTMIGIIILILLIVGFVVLVVLDTISSLPVNLSTDFAETSKPKCVDVTGVWMINSEKLLPGEPKLSLRFTKNNNEYYTEVGQNGAHFSPPRPTTVTCDGKISIRPYPFSERYLLQGELVESRMMLRSGTEILVFTRQ